MIDDVRYKTDISEVQKVMMNLLKTRGGKVESEVNKFKVEFIQYSNFVHKINEK